MFSGKTLAPSLGKCLLPHRFPRGRVMSEAFAGQNLSLGIDGIMCAGDLHAHLAADDTRGLRALVSPEDNRTRGRLREARKA